MNCKKLLALCLGLCISISAGAAEEAAKEETTPPPSLGALTPEQTPLLSGAIKPMQQQNQNTEAQPAATPASGPAPATPPAPAPTSTSIKPLSQ